MWNKGIHQPSPFQMHLGQSRKFLPLSPRWILFAKGNAFKCNCAVNSNISFSYSFALFYLVAMPTSVVKIWTHFTSPNKHTGIGLAQTITDNVMEHQRTPGSLWSFLALVRSSRCLAQHSQWACSETAGTDASPPAAVWGYKSRATGLYLFLSYFYDYFTITYNLLNWINPDVGFFFLACMDPFNAWKDGTGWSTKDAALCQWL